MEGVNLTRLALVVDTSRCSACYSCFLACKDEYWNNDYPPYSAGQPKLGQFWLNIIKKERGKYPHIKVAYIPVLCMQCNDAPCIKTANDSAVYKRADGIVIIDPEKAIGQKQIVDACPYKVISWNEDKKIPQKCTFCVHRLERGEIPRCVQACPSQALTFGDLDDPESEISKLVKLSMPGVFHPEYGTKPNVYYIDLYKITKCFIGGSIALKDTDDCAENVKVALLNQATGETKTVYSNNFGAFEFDGLETNCKYTLSLEYSKYQSKSLKVELENDIYLGYVFLEKA